MLKFDDSEIFDLYETIFGSITYADLTPHPELIKKVSQLQSTGNESNKYLANVLFSSELAKRLHGTSVSTYALHPGVVDTEIWRALPDWARPLLRLRGLLTAEEGAHTTLHCAMNAPQQESGLYYAESKPTRTAAMGQNSELAAILWKRSEAWVSNR